MLPTTWIDASLIPVDDDHFRARYVITLGEPVRVHDVDVSLAGYREQEAVALASRFKERLQAISGVVGDDHDKLFW